MYINKIDSLDLVNMIETYHNANCRYINLVELPEGNILEITMEDKAKKQYTFKANAEELQKMCDYFIGSIEKARKIVNSLMY